MMRGGPGTPSALQMLIEALRVLPGVGPKSAQRMAYHLLQHDREGASRLAEALAEAAESIHHCSRCNTFTEQDVCETCLDPRRDASVLCVVETPADQMMIEQTLTYRGQYFVLMGRLSPLDNIGPKEIHLERLLAGRPIRRWAGRAPKSFSPPTSPARARPPRTTSARCSRRAASRCRGWRAVCRWAASWNTWTRAPSPARCWTGASSEAGPAPSRQKSA